MPDTRQPHGKPENGPFDDAGLRSALARIQSRLGNGGGDTPDRAMLDIRGTPRPLQPLEAINLLARLWGLPSGPDAAPATPASGAGALIAAGAQLGLSVSADNRVARQITAKDCPCLVMTADGLAYPVLRINEADGLDIATDADPQPMTRSDLARGAVGQIFRVERRGITRDTSGKPQGRVADGTTKPSPAPVVQRIAHTLTARKRLLASLVISSILINLLGLLLPMFSMTVFDRVIPHAAMETLWALALGITAALVLELALRHARLKISDAVSQSISHGLQGELAARQLTTSPANVPKHSGGLIQPVSELDGMAVIAPSLVVGVAVDLPFFLLMMALIGSLSGPIVIAPLVGAVLLVAFHVLAHAMAHRSSTEQAGLARRQQQHLIDMVTAQERIRLTGAAGYLLARFEQTADDVGFANHQVRYWHGMAAQASAIIVQLVVVTTIVIGVLQVNAAAMTIGALTACMLLVSRSMMPLSTLVGLVFRVLQLLQSAGQTASHLTAEPQAGGDQQATSARRIEGRIDFAGVAFSYPGEDRAALQNLNFTIRPGERIGIIGKSGCGKSTLLRLMVRLADAHEGRIKLDDRDLRQYDPTTIRQAIGLMPQDAPLTDGTLQDNLLLGLGNVDQSVFESVCHLTGVHDIAARRPQGYSLQVGPGGQRLSVGERQCVSLARTLMGQPKVLLLDEPTSAFDNGHEQRLVSELRQLPADIGIVIATHRMAMLSLVDRVIWIDGGRIVADGPKDEIFKRHGLAA
jgi:ATP-binding cassette, subfamily C, bacterial LapB